MTANINNAIDRIKQVGLTNVRIVPMAGQTVGGSQQIEIREGKEWNPLVSGLTRRMAEDIVNQASNRVILG